MPPSYTIFSCLSKRNVCIILFLSAFYIFSLTCYSQNNPEQGLPFITNYTPKQFKAAPQAFSVIEDNDGIMYFGIQSNLLEYDGVKWRKTLTSSSSGLIRSFAKDKNGRIYYGDVGDFGYIAHDSLGQVSFVSFLKYVPDSMKNFFDVWTVNVADEGIYFQSRERIFRLNEKNEIKAWTPQTRFMYSFYLDGEYYVHEQGVGLLQLKNDKLQLIPGSEFLGQERMQVMLPYTPASQQENGKKQYLVGLFYSGLFVFDGNTFRPFNTEVDAMIKESTLYKGIRFENGNYGLSTTGKGLAIIDSKGKLIQLLNRGTGLQDESVYAVYPDSKGTVWLALDNGISRVETSSPITRFGSQSGILTSTLSVMRFKEALYVGTTNGLLKFNKSKKYFENINAIPQNQVFTLVKDPGHLYIANDGLFSIGENNKLSTIRPSIGGDLQLSGLFISVLHPQMLLGGSTLGVAVFVKDKKQGDYKYLGDVPGLNNKFWSFGENQDGTIWAGTQGGIIYLITPAFDKNGYPELNKFTVTEFGEKDGLVKALGGVWQVKNENYFPGDSVLYRFDSKTRKFFVDTAFSKSWSGGGIEQFDMVEDSSGNVWIRFGKETLRAEPQSDGTYKIDRTALLPVSEYTLAKFYPDKDGIIWISTTDGLIRYDENIKKNYDQSFKTLIRHISTGKQLLPLSGDKNTATVNYGENTIRFEYAAPFYEQEEKTLYQTWLEGFEKTWSDWDNNYYKEYTNLPEGNYHFHVRAMNVYKKISEDAVYTFTVQPPLWRAWWAYLLYAVLLGAVIYAFIRYRTRHLQEQHKALEKIVDERTTELNQKVQETKLLLAETEKGKKNVELLSEIGKQITASLDFETIFSKLYEHINQLADATVFGVGLYNAEKQELEYKYAVEKGKRYKPYTRTTKDKNQFPVWCIENKKPVFINDVTKEYKNYIDSFIEKDLVLEDGTVSEDPLSLIYLPLMVKDKVLGVITIQSFKTNAYTNYHLNLLQNLATYTGIALDNANAYRQLNEREHEIGQRAAELSAVNSVSQALVSQINTDELIKLVGDSMKELFKANIVYLAMLDKKTNMLHFSYQYGEEMPSRKIGDGLTSKIILTGKPLLINKDVEEKTEELGVQRIGRQAASYLGVPIPVEDEIIGVLSVQSTEQENRFDENDLRLLSTIAASVGVALRKARLFEEVQSAKMDAETARKTAEKANAAKSAFLSTVSHELRTPLTSVLGFAKIIKKRLEERIFPSTDKSDPKIEKATQQVSENLNVVISEGERLTSLINDVLDLAKIEAGRMEWNMENVSLNEVVERATAATTALFDQKNLKLEKQFENDLPEISGDRDKLIQVVVNLISNAVKFTNEGNVTCRVARQKDEIIVSVTDTGIGIAKEDYGAVFEQFKQVGGDTLTDKPKGTGLGLPICKEIIEHHGGRIWLESEVGKGSTFSFALPVVKQPLIKPIQFSELVRQLKEQVAQSNLNTKGRKATILVVDDDDSIRSLLQQELGDAGYIIEEAMNGKEAVNKVRRQKPDLIILDIMMPEMNGFDVAAVLKNDPQTMDIPIIVLSIVQDKTRGFRIGVDRYLTKPIDTNLLFNEIGNLLEQGKSKKKVMVVDEDSGTVNTLTDVLKAKGYNVVESDGKELVEKAVATQPDIIMINSILSGKQEVVQTLRFEKGLENVLFLVYQ